MEFNLHSLSLYILSIAMAACFATSVAALEPVHLRCEYAQNPLGIDIASPRLSWKVTSAKRGESQFAYRVLVASAVKKLATDVGDLWDSGKVPSDQTLFVDQSR